jgi:4-amino-4-deoxy-L-arabinose transferase-like glycosyltransferase
VNRPQPPAQDRRSGWWLPCAASAAALALYFLSRSLSLDDFDSASFALALDQFDLALQQPQPPGYPVYVALGRLFRLAWPDARSALTALGAFGGAASVGLVCWLGMLVFRRDGRPDRAAALAAAALFALIPLHWLTASKALSDAPGLALALGALALVWAGRDDDRLLVAGAALMGFSLGVRPQANLPGLLLLGAVALQRLAHRRWQPLLLAALSGAAACMIWFIPTVISAGGLAAYRTLLAQTGDLVWGTDSLFGAGPVTATTLRARTLEFLETALRPTLGITVYQPLGASGWLKVGALAAFIAGGLALSDWRRKESWLLLGWFLLAAIPLFLLESLSRERRFIVLLPPLALLVGGGWGRARPSWPRLLNLARWLATGAAAAALLAEGWPLARTLATVPAPHTQAAQAVAARCRAGDTLVAAAGSFRAAQIELPGYTLAYLYAWDGPQVRQMIAADQPDCIAVLDRDVFEPFMEDLTQGDSYIPVLDQTFTRDPRVHLLANEVRLQILIPAEQITAADLALPAGGLIDIGGPDDGRFLGAGWFRSEDVGGPRARWAGDRETSILRAALAPGAYTLEISALAYPPAQQVTVIVNGQDAGAFDLAQAWATYSLPFTVGEGVEITAIELRHAALLSAYDQTGGASPDRRLLAAAYDWVSITPR